MPTLPTQRTLGGIAPFVVGDGPESPMVRGDQPFGVRTKLNSNLSLVQDFVQQQEQDISDISAAVWGRSVLEGIELSVGSGLNIDNTSGTWLIGFVISVDAGSITVLPNASPGYVFAKQDGSYEVNLTGTPPAMSNFELCRYTSDGSDVLSIIETSRDPEKVLPAKIRKVSGSTLVWVDVGTPTVVTITHTRQLEIPGFKTISAVRGDVTAQITQSDLDTETTFRVLCTYADGSYYYNSQYYHYFYAYYPGLNYYQETVPCWLNWTRSGLGYEE